MKSPGAVGLEGARRGRLVLLCGRVLCGALWGCFTGFVGGVYSLFTGVARRVLWAVSGAVGAGRGIPPGGGIHAPASEGRKLAEYPRKTKRRVRICLDIRIYPLYNTNNK